MEHVVYYGALEQRERERALIQFRNGTYKILLSTDLAARGLDIPEIQNVVHYQIPKDEYNQFCGEFQFIETQDQKNTILEIENDLLTFSILVAR